MDRHALRLTVSLLGMLAVGSVWTPAAVLARTQRAGQSVPSTSAIREQVKAQLDLLSNELMPGCAVGGDPRPAIRKEQQRAIQQLASLGPAVVPVLKPHWARGNTTLREHLLQIFALVGDSASRTLIFQALKDRDPQVRSQAVKSMAALQPLPAEVLPRLFAIAKGKDMWLPTIAMDELIRLVPLQPPSTRPGLLKQLSVLFQRGDGPTKAGVVQAVATLAPRMPEAVPMVLRALEDSDSYVRSTAVDAVSRWKEHAPVVVPALQPLAEDPDPFVRMKVLSGLTAFQEAEAPRHLPAVRAVLADPKASSGHDEALLFLARWGEPGDAALLASAIEREQWRKPQLIQRIAQVESPRPETVALLGALLRKPLNEQEKRNRLLGMMGRDTRSIDPTHQALAKALGKQGRPGAMELLRVFGPEHDDRPELTRAALFGLRQPVAEAPEEIVPVVLDRLHRDASGELSTEAVQTLALGGSRAVQLTEAWATQGPSRRKQLLAMLKQAVPPQGP